jgi:hypothetical protein
MTTEQSVVTPERFAQGLTYEAYLGKIERNQARFQENYDGTKVAEDDARALRELVARPDGPARCLALAEDWYPDVFRGLPVIARIAEASGMELRVFLRDQNKDIMTEFLKGGEHESIPALVFYTRDHHYIAHWIERPALANEQLPLLRDVTAPLRNQELPEEERKQALQGYIDFQNGPVWAGWRDATVREIRALLEERCR